MKFWEAIELDKELAENSDKFDIILDLCHSYEIIYKVPIVELPEEDFLNELPRLANLISEALPFVEPERRVFTEKRMNMKQIVREIKKQMEKSFEIEKRLISSISDLTVDNAILFNKILLKHLRIFEHGFHSCGRIYEFRQHSKDGLSDRIYTISTLDAHKDEYGKSIWSRWCHEITIYQETYSIYHQLKKGQEIIYSFRENIFILKQKEFKQFLSKLFDECLFVPNEIKNKNKPIMLDSF